MDGRRLLEQGPHAEAQQLGPARLAGLRRDDGRHALRGLPVDAPQQLLRQALRAPGMQAGFSPSCSSRPLFRCGQTHTLRA